MEVKKINSRQSFWLVIVTIIPTIILLIPRYLIGEGRQIGWLSVLVSGFLIGIINYILLKLSFDYSSNSLVSDCKEIFGSIIGKLILIPYVLFLIDIDTFLIEEGTSFISIVVPKAPEIGFEILISLLVIYIVYSGIESLARVVEIGMILLILSVGIILIADYYLIDVKLLFPLTFKPNQIIKASLFPNYWFILPTIVFLVIKPYLKEKEKALKAILWANLFSQFVVVVLIIVSISVLGVELSSILNFPFYMLSKLTLIGLEVIIFVAWIIGITLKISTFYYISIKLISDLFELNSYKKLILPFSIMILAVAAIRVEISLIDLTLKYFIVINFFVIQLPLTIIFIIGYLVKRKKGGKNE